LVSWRPPRGATAGLRAAGGTRTTEKVGVATGELRTYTPDEVGVWVRLKWIASFGVQCMCQEAMLLPDALSIGFATIAAPDGSVEIPDPGPTRAWLR